MVEKFSVERDPRSDREGSGPDESHAEETVVVTVAGERHELSRAEAHRLRTALGEALTERRAFLRTVGTHREDGSYVVERRRANSSGHRKVFERFADLRTLYDGLPDEFTAEDVGRADLTGGRRHVVVHHLVEHPAFDCELVSRQPLTAEKRGATGDADEPSAGGGTGD